MRWCGGTVLRCNVGVGVGDAVAWLACGCEAGRMGMGEGVRWMCGGAVVRWYRTTGPKCGAVVPQFGRVCGAVVPQFGRVCGAVVRWC